MMKKLLILIFIVGFIHFRKLKVSAESGTDNNDNVVQQCNNDLSLFLPLPYSNLQNMVCTRIWNSYLLQYSQTQDNVINIVLSTPYTTGWVGIGFSKDGMMLNSSCMVGWINPQGHANIKQYYVQGFTPSEIKVDEGELPLTNGVPPYVAIHNATIYLAFQLKYQTPLKSQPILLAYSSKFPHHHHLTIHDDKTSFVFDFSKGNSADSAPTNAVYGIYSMKKTHGVLSIVGWGLFLPYGAIIARYLKHKDPLWYYLHVVIQFLSFLIGFAALVVGVSLNHRLHANVQAHKTIGVFVLVFTILQVMAFFVRPNKDSKRRKYWNLYHSWTGRSTVFLAVVNIMLGIHIGDAGRNWKISYGFLLGITLFACIVLEAMTRLKKPQDKQPFSTNFQMNSI